jgi:plastocyanin
MRRLCLASLAALATVALSACGGTTSSPAGVGATSSAVASTGLICEKSDAATTGSVEVTIKDFAFDPQPVQAKVDQPIVWGNDDSAPHTASLADGSCGTDQISGGANAALVFHAAGTYTYQCNVHPGQMKDYTIEVTE